MPGVAFGQMADDVVVHAQGLLEHKQVLLAPVARTMSASLALMRRWRRRASTFASRCPATMSRMMARPVWPITSVITPGELDVHLHQCLLHALHPAGLPGNQRLVLACHRTQYSPTQAAADAAKTRCP